ncbi:unnamed protein product [Tuber aestivum]|uniref:Uncharacterized protein n=1 Tax=Tuber aestivum TaxID=59557 RepID=A0A292PQR6_9PEZI|nr:unnamed protein product [Tuber aestivum]
MSAYHRCRMTHSTERPACTCGYRYSHCFKDLGVGLVGWVRVRYRIIPTRVMVGSRWLQQVGLRLVGRLDGLNRSGTGTVPVVYGAPFRQTRYVREPAFQSFRCLIRGFGVSGIGLADWCALAVDVKFVATDAAGGWRMDMGMKVLVLPSTGNTRDSYFLVHFTTSSKGIELWN